MMKRAPSSAAKSAPPAVQEASRAARALPFLFAVLVLLLIGAYAYKAKNNISIGGNNVQVTQGDAREMQALINKVSSVVAVNADEIPSIATIEDITMVRAQNPILYRGAQNGDRLLVWSDKAVVFSSSQEKVLSVMPLIKDQGDIQYVQRLISALNGTQIPVDSASTTATSTQAITNPTVEVRNGTPTAGRARTTSDSLKAAGFNTVAPGDAGNKNYTKTVIYVSKQGVSQETIDKLKQATGGDIVTSLTGEAAPKADIVVIIGG